MLHLFVVVVVVFEVEFGKYEPLFSFTQDPSFGLVFNSLSRLGFLMHLMTSTERIGGP